MEPLPPAGHQWRVAPWLIATRAVGSVGFAAAALIVRGPGPTTVAALIAAALAVFVLRDLIARSRLTVDPTGITVITGFATPQYLDWADIEAIKEDRRPRFGVTTSSLEIDAGDSIHLFGSAQLNADCAVVAQQLREYGLASEGGRADQGDDHQQSEEA